MTSNIKIDDIYKNLNDFKEIPFATNYLISKTGLVYNKKTKNYLFPTLHKNSNFYYVNLNAYKKQNQTKHLLYITFIDPILDLELLTNKYKYCINIKYTNNSLPFINFTIDDLEYKSKSDILKDQKRNNRIINKYDLNYEFIKSYDNIEDIRNELNIKNNKYITLCASKSEKQESYKGFIFRYDDIDELKYNFDENNLMMKEDIDIIENIDENKISLEEFENNLMMKEDIDIDNEIWRRIENDLISTNDTNSILYEISNFGNFRSKKIIMNKRNKLFGTYKISNLSQNIVGNYKQCNLTADNNKIIKLRTNVLVAKYFLTIPERLKNEALDKIVVDHKDHNKLNNHYTNLQYVTYNENNSKKYRE